VNAVADEPAPTMDLIKFKHPFKHGRLYFHPKVIYGFEDPDAAPYFKAVDDAEDVPDDKTPDVIVTLGELDIDPLTIWAHDKGDRRRGQFVMPDRALAKIREMGHDKDLAWATNYTATFIPINSVAFDEHVSAELTAQETAQEGSA
jgi:hypothetical protein